MSNIFLMICIIGPVIASFLLGLIWGLLFKLKIVGRVLQTFLFSTILYLAFFQTGNSWGISPYLIVAICAAFALIYYYLIFPVWEKLDTLEFAGLLRGVFCFFWFGGIASWIIGFISSEQTGKVISALAAIGAIVFYIIKTIPYMKEAWEDKADQLRPHVLIVSIFAVVLTCAFPALIEIGGSIEDAERFNAKMAEYAPLIEASKRATTEEVFVRVIENYQEYHEFSNFTIEAGTPITRNPTRIQSTELNDQIKLVVRGNRLKVTGEAVDLGWGYITIPIEYEGTRGYIEADYIRLE